MNTTTTTPRLSTANTELHTWFERDRAHVRLDYRETTILSVWDEAVGQAMEDGFLSSKGFALGRMIDPRPLHESAVRWANDLGADLGNPIIIHPDPDPEPDDDSPGFWGTEGDTQQTLSDFI